MSEGKLNNLSGQTGNKATKVHAKANLKVDFKQLVHQEQHPPLLRVLYASTATGRTKKHDQSQNQLPDK